MEKIVYLLFYIAISVSIFANDMLTNSELVLYASDKGRDIHYIKGDIFNDIDIADIRFYLLSDNKIIDLREYITKIEKNEYTNSLQLEYKEGKMLLKVEIYPNKIERERLNFYIKGENCDMDSKFAIKITPQREKRYVDSMNNGVYKYDNFYFSGENSKGTTFIAKEEEFENYILKNIKVREKLGINDNLYYIYSNLGNEFKEVFTISFYNYNIKKSSKIISEELVNARNKVAEKQFLDLFLCVDRIMIPDRIDYKKSVENFSIKSKLFYYNLLYNKNFEKNRIFEDSNLKKDDNEALIYYALFFKYLNEKNFFVDREYSEKKVLPEVLSLLDLLELIDEEIIYVQDNIEVYYWYFELINAIENREEFSKEKEFIKEKKQLLEKYVRDNYLDKNGLKTRKIYDKSDTRNIGYINFLSLDEQKKILDKDYMRYYDKKLGVLKINNKNKIDIEYNLNFVISLYRIGDYERGNQIFSTVENYIQKNGNYLVKEIQLNGENNFGIDGQLIYLYMTALTYREN